MVNVYEFKTDSYEYDYVCIHLNDLFQWLNADTHFYRHSQIERNYINTQPISLPSIQEIVNRLQANKGKKSLLVLDMRMMTYSPIHGIDYILNLYKKYTGICFLLDDKELYDRINGEINTWKKHNSSIKKHKIGTNCLYCGDENEFTEAKKHLSPQPILSIIDNDINQYIFTRIKPKTKKEAEETSGKIYIYSSNVFANRYFDAKKILTDGSLFSLVIYRMALMIHKSMEIFKITSFHAFICGSLTGACLAAGLSAIFNKPVIYLKNVGPNISVNDERMISRIKRNKHYLFIFDFMCMGKEYERIKMLCDLRSAHIINSVGISYYRFPRFKTADDKKGHDNCHFDWNEELRLTSLFHVNAFEKNYYYCWIEEKE